ATLACVKTRALEMFRRVGSPPRHRTAAGIRHHQGARGACSTTSADKAGRGSLGRWRVAPAPLWGYDDRFWVLVNAGQGIEVAPKMRSDLRVYFLSLVVAEVGLRTLGSLRGYSVMESKTPCGRSLLIPGVTQPRVSSRHL